MTATELTTQDMTYIEETLGRIPRGILAVSSRSPDGLPVALKMKCVVEKAPFPTHFWLCHALLIEKINFLESQRIVKPMEELIETDNGLAALFLADQKRYQQIRNKCLTEEDIKHLSTINILDQFKDKRGIGGIENLQKIRCLHMQIAHLVSDANVIGQWLQDKFDLLNFSEDLKSFRERLKKDKLIENAFQKSL